MRLPPHRPAFAFAVLAVALLALAPAPTTTAAARACADPEMVPGLGAACAVPGGWLMTLANGQVVFTHGPDPIRPPTAVPAAALADPGVACVDESEPHIRIIYALPRLAPVTTAATGFASREPQIVAGVLQANAVVYANAMEFGVPMRWKVLCDETGALRIDAVTLSVTASQASFGTIANDLLTRGYGNAVEKVLVFYDGSWAGCGGCGGYSTIPGGDEASEANANNFGWGSYSVVFMGNYGTLPYWVTDEVILHEVTHALGGVQPSAPNSSGGWHCNDGWDIMCYSDGGSKSAYGARCFPVGHTFAGAAMPYDCGNDDYFHPAPAPGSYLDTHWNVAQNRFLARG